MARSANWEKRLIATGKKSINRLFLSLCKPMNSQMATVKRVSSADSNAYYRNAMVCPSGMLLETENFLNGNLLRDRLHRHPREVLQKIAAFCLVSGDLEYWVIAADVCRYLARRATIKNAVAFYLSAYYYSYTFLKKRRATGESVSFSARDFCLIPIIHIANEAMAGIFRHLKTQKLIGSPAIHITGINGERFSFEKPLFHLSVPRESVVDFSLCSDFDVKGLALINRHPGGGVPMVAKISSQQLSNALKTPGGLTIPVTMVIQAKELADGSMSLRPVFQDTSIRESICIEEGRLMPGEWILARDFTTPFACFLHAIGQRNLLTAMLKPAAQEKITGLFMVEPYQPGKIPVVFIHGLLSSPETWGEMVNSLKNDPKIRQKYQFWFYSYSTGNPVLASANHLRRALLAAKEEFCTSPETTANFEKMVLIGHSMGGLIARLLLQQKPEYLLERLTRCARAELREKLSADEMKHVEDFVLQYSLDFIHRAIFMAVPHRGAAMARQKLARLGIDLTKRTEYLAHLFEEFKKIYLKLCPDTTVAHLDRAFSGIGNLNPDNPFVAAIGDSPMKTNVTFHSIIGDKNGENNPGGSDGIVPYSSSHLDAAASECIVKSHHSVHQTPAAILEVLRILLLHLE